MRLLEEVVEGAVGMRESTVQLRYVRELDFKATSS
jgi:hypothetical protein